MPETATKIAEAAGEAKINSGEELNNLEIDGKKVSEIVDEESAKTGEKLQARRVVTHKVGHHVLNGVHRRHL